MRASRDPISNHYKHYGPTVGSNSRYGEETNLHYTTTYTSIILFRVAGTHLHSYFMKENLERLFLPDYMPTNLDILHCRLKTTGITETLFQLGQLSYRYGVPELN